MQNGTSPLHSEDFDKNKYLQAIKYLVTILQYYNSSKRIASYGFGAHVVPGHRVSDCFSLTGDIFSPQVNGIGPLVNAYK